MMPEAVLAARAALGQRQGCAGVLGHIERISGGFFWLFENFFEKIVKKACIFF
ncbi:hypothetical protein [Anaerovibrio slackiae]|uniref:hypothetical protein n=1 Tax=Anaerovibrio slackiae TaxID=2652309 RepID=UPI00386C1130